MRRLTPLLNSASLLLALLCASCQKDVIEPFPSMINQLGMGLTDEHGKVVRIFPDGEPIYNVSETKTQTHLPAKDFVRLQLFYEVKNAQDPKERSAILHACTPVRVLVPVKIDKDAARPANLKPIKKLRAWMGGGFLNVEAEMASGQNAQNSFVVEEINAQKKGKDMEVTLHVRHYSPLERNTYNRKAYISIPLMEYQKLCNPGGSVKIELRYDAGNKHPDPAVGKEWE